MNDPALEFRDLHRHFDRQEVLRGVTFAVQPGEVYALLGRNGSGKTTLLRTLLGFLEPHHGSSRILGLDSRKLTPAHRGRVGYVSEGHRLYGTMRVQDALRFEAGTRDDFRTDFAEQAMNRCGLRPGAFVGLLSRGQRAQLSLILAAAGRPEVLICDDPAMGLDVVMRREFLDALIDLLADRGCAVLFSSHVMTDVERIADRVGILHEGSMLVDAPLDELKNRIQRRQWAGDGLAPPDDPRVLRARPRRGGFDVTLLDCDDELEARLAGTGQLSSPQPLNLEELFLDLVSDDAPRSLLADPVEVTS